MIRLSIESVRASLAGGDQGDQLVATPSRRSYVSGVKIVQLREHICIFLLGREAARM